MAVATIEAGVLRTGNGVVVAFAFPFRAQVPGDIKVASVTGQVLTVLLPATYTVLLAAASGTVTFGVAPLNGAVIYIYRETAQTQLVSVSSQNAYNPTVVEGVWDKLTMRVQELSAAIVRSVKVAPGGNADTLVAQIIAAQAASAVSAAAADADRIAAAASATAAASSATAAASSATLPPLAGNALRVPRVNAAATSVEFVTVTTAGWALLDDANAAAQLVTLGVTATAAQINQLATLPIASLTLAQANNINSTVFGTVSGQLFYQTLKSNLNASGAAQVYACRAWVNFDGTGTVAILASGNVSSITDNGVGDYTVNLGAAMQDANYVAVTGGMDSIADSIGTKSGFANLAGSCRVVSGLDDTPTFVKFDIPNFSVAIFR